MAHQCGWQRDDVAIVAGRLHLVGRPRRGVSWVGEGDIAAGRNCLQPEPHCADAVGIRHVRADRDRVVRGRRSWLMYHGIDKRRRVAGQPDICAARRRRGCTPGARHRVVGSGRDQIHGSLDRVSCHRPREADAVGDAVHLLGAVIAQDHIVAVVAKASLPRAKCRHSVGAGERAGFDAGDEIAARLDDGACREGVFDGAVQRPVGQIDRLCAGVVELHKFQEIACRRRIIVDFVDDDLGSCIFGGVGGSGLERQRNQERAEHQQEFGPRHLCSIHPAAPPRPSQAGSRPVRFDSFSTATRHRHAAQLWTAIQLRLL